METGRKQTSQEIRLLGLKIPQLLELRTSPNVEIQRPPSSCPSSENGGGGSSLTQPQISPSCPDSFCGFPSPPQGVFSPKTKSDCISKIFCTNVSKLACSFLGCPGSFKSNYGRFSGMGPMGPLTKNIPLPRCIARFIFFSGYHIYPNQPFNPPGPRALGDVLDHILGCPQR